MLRSVVRLGPLFAQRPEGRPATFSFRDRPVRGREVLAQKCFRARGPARRGRPSSPRSDRAARARDVAHLPAAAASLADGKAPVLGHDRGPPPAPGPPSLGVVRPRPPPASGALQRLRLSPVLAPCRAFCFRSPAAASLRPSCAAPCPSRPVRAASLSHLPVLSVKLGVPCGSRALESGTVLCPGLSSKDNAYKEQPWKTEMVSRLVRRTGVLSSLCSGFLSWDTTPPCAASVWPIGATLWEWVLSRHLLGGC